mmetsp:Transcript_548/g.1705  ORF Transcript_548/g.1705 Transcript_548/m.1705 type:complete len:240 (+) Transcript_548:158-877(+)
MMQIPIETPTISPRNCMSRFQRWEVFRPDRPSDRSCESRSSMSMLYPPKLKIRTRAVLKSHDRPPIVWMHSCHMTMADRTTRTAIRTTEPYRTHAPTKPRLLQTQACAMAMTRPTKSPRHFRRKSFWATWGFASVKSGTTINPEVMQIRSPSDVRVKALAPIPWKSSAQVRLSWYDSMRGRSCDIVLYAELSRLEPVPPSSLSYNTGVAAVVSESCLTAKKCFTTQKLRHSTPNTAVTT